MATKKSSTRSPKRAAPSPKKVKDPIVDAIARFKASANNDVAHMAAMDDIETKSPTTKRGADLLAKYVRYMLRISKGDGGGQAWHRLLRKMMKRAIDCREQLSARAA